MITNKSEKKVVGFDLDGTLLKGNSCFSFSIYLLKKGIFSLSDFLYIVFTYTRHKYFGLSLKSIHQKVFQRLFFGKEAAIFESHIDQFIDHWLDKSRYLPAINQLKEFQNNKDTVAIFSNSPLFLVGAIAEKLGVSEVYATRYSVDSEGILCDIAHILEGDHKAVLFHDFAKSANCTDTIVFSDSMHDLPFLQAAACPIAVRPKRSLKRIAKKLGWKII